MRSVLGCLVLLSATLALAAAPVPKEKPKVKDEEAIIGTWGVEKFDAGGEAGGPPEAELMKLRLVFKKDGKVQAVRGSGPDRGDDEYKLDPTAKVKTIDIIHKDGPNGQEMKVLGIYELEGDTLKLCIAEGRGATRPLEMKATGARQPVITLKRMKDETPAAKPEEKKPAPPVVEKK